MEHKFPFGTFRPKNKNNNNNNNKNRTTISDVPLLITESFLRKEQFLLVFHIHWPPGISEICWQMLSNQQSAVLAVAVVVGG